MSKQHGIIIEADQDIDNRAAQRLASFITRVENLEEEILNRRVGA